MICTDTDNYVNAWSTIKKEKKKETSYLQSCSHFETF